MDVYDYNGYPATYLQPPPEQELVYQAEGGYGEYYGLDQLHNDDARSRRSYSRHRRNSHDSSSSSTSATHSSASWSHTCSTSAAPDLLNYKFREPSFMDAFRVMYLNETNKNKKNTTQYLATKKKQDHIEEILERDGLGSKKWLFYPRSHRRGDLVSTDSHSLTNYDRRVQVDGEFLRRYRKNKLDKQDAPITKLKKWELMLYKKLGFVQTV